MINLTRLGSIVEHGGGGEEGRERQHHLGHPVKLLKSGVISD